MKRQTLAARLAFPHVEPWHAPLYLAQCFTFRLARAITGTTHNVTTGEEAHAPPFCLRLRPAYRTPAVQAFRDTVAAHARKARRPRAAKTEWLSKWDEIPETPRPVARHRVAELLRASRSRRGKGNAWRVSAGYWIRDAGLTLTRKS